MRDFVKLLLRPLVPAKLRPKLRKIYSRVRYWGPTYRCPFCRSRLRTFAPLGLKLPVLERQNVIGSGYRRGLCPVCESLDRERLVYLYLLHKTDLFQKPMRLLHVAPEKNLAHILHGQRSLDYLTADLDPKRAMVEMDITAIRLSDASFDAVICNHVLEHVVDDRKAVSELYRILRPGGWAILQAPISLALKNTYEDFSLTTREARREAFGQGNHVRIYAQDYKQRLEQAGFEVRVFDWTMEVEKFGGAKNRFGLHPQERLYFAVRRGVTLP